MLDQATEHFLQDTVEDFMRDRTSFTSLDVCNIAKSASYRVRNYEVANWLRENAITMSYDGGFLYNQSLIKVDSKAVGMTLAYCYHYYKDSTDDYLDRDQNPKSFMRRIVPTATSAFDALPNVSSFPSILAQVSCSPVFFSSREAARTYARENATHFRFKDQGYNTAVGERWSCLAR